MDQTDFWGTLNDDESLGMIADSRYLSLVLRKPVFGVSDQVRHKQGCIATEA